VLLDNLNEVVGDAHSKPEDVTDEDDDDGTTGGESEEHKALKQFIADHPERVGLKPDAIAHIEHTFRTGDRVDVLFKGGGREVTAVEIEVEGEEYLMTGAHQAVKYRALAAAAEGIVDVGPSHSTRAVLAAYVTDYPKVWDFCNRYGIDMVRVDRADVFTPGPRPA
jgi:acetylornithine deacetylase/succinyl-diaminopimelate desuccinylase-like protein